MMQDNRRRGGPRPEFVSLLNTAGHAPRLGETPGAANDGELLTWDQATGRYIHTPNGAITWDDYSFPFTQTRQGALGKPDFDEENVGYLFPQNDPTERLFAFAQMPHRWAEGTTIYPHVHWRQAAATAVTWKVDYKICPKGAAVPAVFTTISGNTGLFTYTAGAIHQLTPIGSGILMVGYDISTVIKLRIYRDDNTTVGDVVGWDFDIHFQVDSNGSLSQYTK